MRFGTVWSLVALALVTKAYSAGLGTESFLTRPDIHGDEAVFTAEGDLWIANLGNHITRRLTSDRGVETDAHFSPDGNSIAFTAAYDRNSEVYVMPTSGGIPKRLTFIATGTTVLGWTPDGKNILYRQRGKTVTTVPYQLFTVPAVGGVPTPVAVPKGSFGEFNADGHRLAYVPDTNEWMNWFRYQAGEADQIWVADLAKGSFEQVTHGVGVDTQPVWVGNMIYFVSERTGVRNLWRIDPATKQATQITHSTTAPVRYPASDGHRVIFEIGPQLGVYDPETGAVTVQDIHLGSDRLHARTTDFPIAPSIEGAGIGPTGKRVALVSRGQLVTVPVKDGELHSLVTDSHHRVQYPAWSPDGKRLAYISDASSEEQLWTIDATNGGTPKKLTSELKGEHFQPVWSPDGKYLVVGDREMRIQLVDATTGTTTLVDQADRSGSYDTVNQDFAFSPDSKWLAYSKQGFGWNTQVWLYNLSSGKSTAISDITLSSISPTFSPDGKFLYMIQQRALTPSMSGYNAMLSYEDMMKVSAVALAADTKSPFEPKDEEEGAASPPEPAKPPVAPPKPILPTAKPDIKVDLVGIQDRIIDMKVPAGGYITVLAVPGKLLILDAEHPNQIGGAGPGNLQSFDIATKALTPIASGVQSVQLSGDGTKVLVTGPGGPRVLEAESGAVPATAGAIKLAGFTVAVDPAAEWSQIYEESWRIIRDFFYDPNLHGVDWAKVHEKYRAELPMVGDRSDLTRLCADMLSELNTGHCYVGGPSPYAQPGRPMGFLGADLEWDAVGHAYRIKHLLQSDKWSLETSSPLAEPGLQLNDGDYIFEIGGKALRKDEDPQALLIGTAGQTISLKVGANAKPSEARVIRVVPLASERELRYLDWVQGRREYVRKASGGQLAYVHMSDMEAAGANGFTKDYYGNVDKAGLIIDVRANGGGSISANILNHLATPITGYFKPRYGKSWRREGWAPLGKVVAITDQWAFSDGELFSEGFKALKIGPLIGHRTGGGEVGSGGGYHLMDGGVIYVPNYGAWTADGKWIIEGKGVEPDIEIDQDPSLVMEGKDPQLDKAIEVLLAGLKAHPLKVPTPPPFPVKTGGSRGQAG